VKVWDAGTGQELVTLRGHSGGVHYLMFSPDSRRLHSASFAAPKTGADGERFEVRTWDATPLPEVAKR